MLAGRKNRLGQMLTPVNVVKMMVLMMMGDKPLTRVETILDPALGTGRFLLEYTLMFPQKPLILFGIEIDLTLYRVALVNMALYSQHPYSVLCADTFRLNDSEHPDVWNLGNQWEPPDMSPYSWHPAPRMTFAEVAKARKEKLQDTNLLGEKTVIAAPPPSLFESYVRARKKP